MFAFPLTYLFNRALLDRFTSLSLSKHVRVHTPVHTECIKSMLKHTQNLAQNGWRTHFTKKLISVSLFMLYIL